MRKVLLSFASAAALGLVVFAASPALATCETGGNQCDTPMLSATDMMVTVETAGVGLTFSQFDGEQGYAFGEQSGESGSSINFSFESDFCPEGCGDGQLTINAWSNQIAGTQAGAQSGASGVPAVTYTENATLTQIRSNITAPSTE